MCGIAGFTIPSGLPPAERAARYGDRLRRMTASLYHRGPDAQRALLADGIALASTRLSIVDLADGSQPMRDPNTGITVVFNGEIYNHVELRERLTDYQFRTRCDTEVILAAFLERGIDCVRDFIGQFAFALWDPRDSLLWLARDRVGVRPLFYARTAEGLAFASEIKAIFASAWLSPAFDLEAIHQTVHLWSPVTPRTTFEGVSTLPAGSVGCFDGETLAIRRYWDLDLSAVDEHMPEKEAIECVGELLVDAVRLRLRADVPVAAYLSGGLDSSLICALAQAQLGGSLQTFSVAFRQSRYDERPFQAEVAAALETEHHSVQVEDEDIGRDLPEVVAHAEQVLLRSAPVPFFNLSRLVRACGTKVVLTGEGADEIFLGYDLYKETKVRQFWAREPGSAHRPRLLTRLYPYLPLGSQSTAMLRQFYGIGLEAPDAPDFSHQIRWTNSGRVARFFSDELMGRVRGHDPSGDLISSLPPRVLSWRPLARAQYIEMQTLLTGYLLSAQGDRMLMGNSVEGRFPFLDHRLIELAARLPERLKLRGLAEKYVLKRIARDWVPAAVTRRHKYPYRAPIAEGLVGAAAPAATHHLFDPDAVKSVGVFSAEKVGRLKAKLSSATSPPSEADNMALMAVASTQLLASAFFSPRAQSCERVEAVEIWVA
jgi:asparagine synthase (glutamine-hydrolysing)